MYCGRPAASISPVRDSSRAAPTSTSVPFSIQLSVKMAAFRNTLVCAFLYTLTVEAAVPLRSTCLEPTTQKVYSLGDTWYTTGEQGCMKLTCDGEDTISGLTCALFQVSPPCTVKAGNPKAMYPDCCPTPVCADENAIEGSTGDSNAFDAPPPSAYSSHSGYSGYSKSASPRKGAYLYPAARLY